MLTDLTTGRYHRQDTLGQAGVDEDLRQAEGVEGGFGRRLVHDGASRRERWGQLGRGNEERHVPGRDGTDDADVGTTIPTLLPNAIMNNGQACIAQTRILAPRSRYDEVVDALVSGVAALSVGDPLDPATEIGPVVAERQRARIEGYLESGREEGATVAVGGGRPSGLGKGWYVEPTVFSHVDNKMKIAQEEIFGPVLVVIPYDGDQQAVEIANDSNYGLCGSVWTNDNDRGLGIARQVRTGTYMVNGSVPIDFATPFGGFKESGVGREFGPEGLESFLEKKSIALPADYTPTI